MRVFNTKLKDEPLAVSRMDRWNLGLNTLVSPTQIKPNELAEAQDIQLVEDGKIQCPRDGQAYYGASQGSRVTGLFPYYKSDGTTQLLRVSGTTLYKYTNATTWTAISGYTYTTNKNTNAVMAYDRLYLVNGADPLTYYDGSTITSFTSISAPAAPTATPTRGTGGTNSYTYSYKITAVTATGETTPSSAGTATLAVNAVSTTDYVSLSWSAVTSATGYNVYGRKDGSWFFMKYLEGNASTSYVDKGQDTPVETTTPPEGNSTAGPTGKYVTVYKDSLFILGDPNNPSRLYYSGGGDKINDFTVGSGGGFIDISKNDGQVGTGLIVFKDKLLIFKEESVWQFSFSSTGLPQIELVNASVGCIAPRSIVAVENDIFFVSRRGVFTIGNEAGFAFDVLRTNELSAKIRSVFNTIDGAYIQNVAALYATKSNVNLVIFSYTPSGSTTNTKAIVYDRERLAWYKWSNVSANCWVLYNDAGTRRALYGDDGSGYVKEVLTGSSDFGTAIRGYFSLRAEDFKEINRYKMLKDVDMMLRRPSGFLTLTITKDGVETVYTASVGTVSPSINFAHYVIRSFLFKTAYGTGVSSSDELLLKTKKNLNLEGKTFLLTFDNNSVSSFTLLFAGLTAKPRSPRYRKSTDLIS